jgi:DNA-binding MarR family transcriptional regulator
MHKITAPQLVTLLWVVESGSSTASDIAKQIHLSNSTVVGILDRLEAKGLVRRERSTLDRRLVHVCATESGVQLAHTAPSPLQDVLARALHELPELEQTAIALSLERIVDLMAARDLTALPLLDSGEVTEVDESLSFSD